MKNEDINSCVYALIQLSGHSPKTIAFVATGEIYMSVNLETTRGFV